MVAKNSAQTLISYAQAEKLDFKELDKPCLTLRVKVVQDI